MNSVNLREELFSTGKSYMSSSEKRIQYLKEKGKSFKVISTTSTTTIETNEDRFIYSLEKLNNKILMARQKILKDIKNKDLSGIDIDKVKINYIGLKKDIHKNIKYLEGDFLCIDLNSAYINAAHKLGFISQETLEFINKQDKETRLKSLGSICTNRIIETYEEGELIDIPKIEVNEQGRKVFFSCALEIDNLLLLLAKESKESFLFFWVDGIIIKKEFKEKAQKIINSKGYNFKIEAISDINVIQDREYTKIILNKEGVKKEYTFGEHNNLFFDLRKQKIKKHESSFNSSPEQVQKNN